MALVRNFDFSNNIDLINYNNTKNNRRFVV